MSDSAATTEMRPIDDAARSATAKLLLAAAHVPEPDVEAVRTALALGPSAELTVEVALSQRVGPLLWRALSAADAADALGACGDAVSTDRLVRRAQADLLIPRALALASQPLRQAGLEPLLFKGPAVAAQYPEAGLRPMDDIDLLLPPTDVDRARPALLGAGWTPIGRPGDHYDEVFLHPDVPHLPLELHRGLSSWRDQGNTLTLERLWRARRPATILGVDGFVLPPEEDVVALAAHAGKPFHFFSRLIWAVDLAVVVQAHPELDWDRLLAFADDVHCRTVVAVGLRMAVRLGAEVPDDATALPRSQARRDRLAPLLAEGWATAMPDNDVQHDLRYALWDHRRRKTVMRYAEVTDSGLREVPGRIARRTAAFARQRLASPRRATPPR